MVEIILDDKEDWEKRTLCSDESCIGTIGPDGKCKECDKPYEGKLSAGHSKSKLKDIPKEEQNQVSLADADTADDDWDRRVLCSDEACIGVIGPDGKCKECRKTGSK
jgi:hypothetical protein